MINNDRGQSLISKYVWVIETIHRAKKISFEELNRKWLDDDISRGVEIPKRTFDNWRYAIADMFGIFIENEHKGEYRYYIMNEEDITKNGQGLDQELTKDLHLIHAFHHLFDHTDFALTDFIYVREFHNKINMTVE